MRCMFCSYSTVDVDDHEDVYYCPFELRKEQPQCFHSGDECSHDKERQQNDKFKFDTQMSEEEADAWENIMRAITREANNG